MGHEISVMNHFICFQAYYVDDPAWKVASSEKGLQFDAWLDTNRLSFVSCSESRPLGPVYESSAIASQIQEKSSSFALHESGVTDLTAFGSFQLPDDGHPTTVVAPTVGAMSEVEAEMKRAALGLLQLCVEADVHSMSAMTKSEPESKAAIEEFGKHESNSGAHDNAPAGSTALASAPSMGRVQSSSQPSPTVTSFHLFRPDVE